VILAVARRRKRHALILIGSQLVNYSVEHLVAWLYGCEPFMSPIGKRVVPFYMLYRESQIGVPSCFGGRTHPGGDENKARAGIHYRENRTWKVVPCSSNQKQDAGVVITAFDHLSRSVKIVVFGHTGRATEAMGDLLARRPEDFGETDEVAAVRNGGSKGEKTRARTGKSARKQGNSEAPKDKSRTVRVHLYSMKFSHGVTKQPDETKGDNEITRVKTFEF